jgi:hypothetical protein
MRSIKGRMTAGRARVMDAIDDGSVGCDGWKGITKGDMIGPGPRRLEMPETGGSRNWLSRFLSPRSSFCSGARTVENTAMEAMEEWKEVIGEVTHQFLPRRTSVVIGMPRRVWDLKYLLPFRVLARMRNNRLSFYMLFSPFTTQTLVA